MEQSEPPKGQADFAVCDFCHRHLDLTYDRNLANGALNEWIEYCPTGAESDSPYTMLFCKRCARLWKKLHGVKGVQV